MRQDKREDWINAFNNDTPSPDSPDDPHSTPRILVGTLAILGVGYTCVRAFRLVLMGPEWLRKEEDQGFARIRRIGQENETYTYRLVCPNVQVEKGMLNRHMLRMMFDAMAMEVQNDLGITRTCDSPISG